MPAVPKPTPHVLRKAAIAAEERKAWRAVKARVTKRDGGRCRVCGQRGADHHHLLARSLGGRDTDANVVLLCRQCHQYRHAGLLRIDGHAERMLTVWKDRRISPTGSDCYVER